jgi:hypothetical protein
MVLAACSQKPVIYKAEPDTIKKITQANQAVCDYKGRVTVIYENGKENVRFKGYLNKDCKDNFHLKILGLFNSVAYDIKYHDGVVEAYEKGEDVSAGIEYFMRSKGLDSMVSLIRYPHVKVDESYEISVKDNKYLLEKGTVSVVAGQDYNIEKISFGSESFEYVYSDGRMTELLYQGEDMKVEIKLR